MKKTLLLSILSLVTSFSAFSQEKKVWKKASEGSLEVLETAKRETFPTDFELLDLNLHDFKLQLLNAPKRALNVNSNVVISIPLSVNKFEKFRFYEASNFDEALQSQFPDIRSYVGVGVDNPTSIVRLSLDPRGVQMMIMVVDQPTVFVEPYASNSKTYSVYSTNRSKGKLPFTCSTDDQSLALDLNGSTKNLSRSSTGQLLTFRLALSCTAEYANYFGATNSAQYGTVLAAYNATMSRVNGVFEKDFAIHMNIIAQSSNVTYYNAATDPYSDAAAGAGGAWNVELQNTLSSSLTGPSTSLAANNAAYDVGHLFGASGGGGNAGCIGCVCRDDTSSPNDKNKGSGYTSPSNNAPIGDTFDIDYVAHELGHQFGANHTFSMSNEGQGVNVETGSGSTIMGYAGITAQDVQANSDAYFHSVSIAQVQGNMATKTCPVITTITHGTPVVTSGGNWTIPVSTPFALTGSATDTGGNSTLTYCWEQVDDGANQTGANSGASVTKTIGPNFRSYNPTISPTRYFPRLQSTLNNSQLTQGSEIAVEALSSVARTLNFRLTARDNIAGQGQTNFANMTVSVNGTVGPFNVTSQNTASLVWAQGSNQLITWTVNGTTGLVGSTNVNILLSTDGGLTYPTVLASNVPNNGSATITVPSITAPNCRVMVKPTGNIYFDINEKNIAIGNYTYQSQNICTDYVRNFNNLPIPENSGSFTGYAINVPDTYTLSDTNIKVEITHPNLGNIYLGNRPAYLTTGVTQYFNGSCPSAANMNLIFDDQGPVLNCAATTSQAPTKPVGTASFAGYNGNQSNGDWIFFITDIAVGDGITGTIQRVTYNLCRSELVPVLSSSNFESIEDLIVYPNPNNGNFNVQFNSNSSKVTIDVHDIRGRNVYKNTFEGFGLFNQNLNLQHTQSGIYLVSIIDGDRKEVRKIVVN